MFKRLHGVLYLSLGLRIDSTALNAAEMFDCFGLKLLATDIPMGVARALRRLALKRAERQAGADKNTPVSLK
jgi:hypothetical protein